jgi:hypothetical protein
MRKFYKHTYKVVVLSESPDEDDLYDLADNVNEGPDCLHTWELSETKELTSKEAADALYDAGSEPGFFMLDDEGNSMNEPTEPTEPTYRINVLEISGDDGLVTSLRSFPDSIVGQEDAEKLFLEIIKETTDVNVETLKSVLIDRGYCDIPGGGSVQLVRSTQ